MGMSSISARKTFVGPEVFPAEIGLIPFFRERWSLLNLRCAHGL